MELGSQFQLFLPVVQCLLVGLSLPKAQTMMIRTSMAHSICYQHALFAKSEKLAEPLKEPLSITNLVLGDECSWVERDASCDGASGCSAFVRKSCEKLGLLPQRNAERIFGGKPIEPDSYPSFGRLISVIDAQYCGFTILNANWGITAEHCDVLNINPTILVGRYNLSVEEEGEQSREVDKVINYPTENGTANRTVDLKLLHWEEPLVLDGKKVAAAQLYKQKVDEGELTLVGTGDSVGRSRNSEDDETFGQDVAQEVTIPIIPDKICAGSLIDPKDWVVCVGKSGSGLSGCYGDSGGPMYFIDQDKTQYLAGVIAFGNSEIKPTCGSPTVITGGMELAYFYEWIEKEINANKK